MRKIILMFCLGIISTACSKNFDDTKKETKNMDIINSTINVEKQITYGVQLNMRLPYELYINDIKAKYDYTGGNVGVDLNPYLLKNGKCKIKIKIFPAFKAGKTQIPLDDLEGCTILFGKYIKGEKENDIYKYNIEDFSRLDFKIPNKQIATFEQEWEVDITELPYELDGWSKGQDLRKLNQQQLEQKVVNYHKKLLVILNEGDYNSWSKLTSLRFKEYCIYNYLSEESIKINLTNNEKDITKYAKNTMISLEDYEMKIYADGKLVTLEKNTHTDNYNNQSPLDIYSWNPLISKGKISGAADYPILLYLPEGSDDFVIIRK